MSAFIESEAAPERAGTKACALESRSVNEESIKMRGILAKEEEGQGGGGVHVAGRGEVQY